ncbi:unnamed protein product [Calypogeia fissa]
MKYNVKFLDGADLGSQDVELPDTEPVVPIVAVGPVEAAASLEMGEEYIERLIEVSINATTQTPRGVHMVPNDTTMTTVSDGDQSEYEAHFSQGIGKEKKARKQENRTPDDVGKTADKMGKKQCKQLQFNAQEDPGRGADLLQEVLSEAPMANPAPKPASPPRKLKASVGDRGESGAPAPALAAKGEKRRGKDSAAGPKGGRQPLLLPCMLYGPLTYLADHLDCAGPLWPPG